MFGGEMYVLYLILMLSGSFTILSAVAMTAVWCKFRAWRTLMNYTILQRTLLGALQFTLRFTYLFFTIDRIYLQIIFITDNWLLLTIECWSFAATIIAYIKLVWIQLGRPSYELRKWTLVVYAFSSLLNILKIALHRRVLEWPMLDLIWTYMWVSFVMVLNVCWYIRTVYSVMFIQTMSRRGSKHMMSLLGVGVASDVISAAIYVSKFYVLDFIGSSVLETLFSIRLVPLSLFALFNSKSRAIRYDIRYDMRTGNGGTDLRTQPSK